MQVPSGCSVLCRVRHSYLLHEHECSELYIALHEGCTSWVLCVQAYYEFTPKALYTDGRGGNAPPPVAPI